MTDPDVAGTVCVAADYYRVGNTIMDCKYFIGFVRSLTLREQCNVRCLKTEHSGIYFNLREII